MNNLLRPLMTVNMLVVDRLAPTFPHAPAGAHCRIRETCGKSPVSLQKTQPMRCIYKATKRKQSKTTASVITPGRFDNPISPWPELEQLEDLAQAEGLGRVRVRQHVNPLKQELMVPVGPLVWQEVFKEAQRPLAVDVGCGSGRFLLALASRLPTYNLLGLDIRHKLVDRGNEWARLAGLSGRVRFETANATVSLASLLSTYPGPLTLLTIQFPDPHFKARHKKRRVVQRHLVETTARLLVPGGRVFLQSDVEEAAAAMRDEFELWGRTHFQVISPSLSEQALPGPFTPNGCDRSGTECMPERSRVQSPDPTCVSSSVSLPVISANAPSSSSPHQSTFTDREPAGQHLSSNGSRVTENEKAQHMREFPCLSSAAEENSAEAAQSLATSEQWHSGTQSSMAASNHDRESGRRRVEELAAGTQLQWGNTGWLNHNPLGIPTEREVATPGQGGCLSSGSCWNDCLRSL
eukprot:jgi/Botrbrau1/865/Bobra.0352s0055.2